MGGILTQLLAGLAGGTNAYEHQQDTAAKEKIAAELHQAQMANIQSEMQNRQEQRYTQGFRPGQAPDAKGILSGLNLGAGVADAGGAPGVSVASQVGNTETQQAAPDQYAPDRFSQVNPSTYIDNTATPEAVQSRHDERSAINAMRIAAAKPTPQQHVVDPVTGEVKFYDPTKPPSGLRVHPQPRDSFSFPVVAGPDGVPVVARANTRTGQIEPTDVGAKPSASATKLTEPQEKSHLFYKLMASSEPQIEAAMQSGQVRKAAVTAYMLSPDMAKPLTQASLNAAEQSLIRSFKDFAAGVLRKESGAAVTTAELREVWERYGPGFGDNPALDTEKLTARKSYMDTMKQQAGPALKFYEHQSNGAGSPPQGAAHVTPAERAALKAQGFTDAQIDAIKP